MLACRNSSCLRRVSQPAVQHAPCCCPPYHLAAAPTPPSAACSPVQSLPPCAQGRCSTLFGMLSKSLLQYCLLCNCLPDATGVGLKPLGAVCFASVARSWLTIWASLKPFQYSATCRHCRPERCFLPLQLILKLGFPDGRVLGVQLVPPLRAMLQALHRASSAL